MRLALLHSCLPCHILCQFKPIGFERVDLKLECERCLGLIEGELVPAISGFCSAKQLSASGFSGLLSELGNSDKVVAQLTGSPYTEFFTTRVPTFFADRRGSHKAQHLPRGTKASKP